MRTVPTRADRQRQTRDELVAAADRRFSSDGFHATSLDAVADEAGYTKGAVYSNFASKEDLFFAVYERRVERRIEETGALLDGADTAREGLRRVAAAAIARREADDGWLAVFFEFWAHVLRHPEHRERFAQLHGRVIEQLAGGLERHAGEAEAELLLPPDRLAMSLLALATGLGLERLTQPGLDLDELLDDLSDRLIGGGGGDGSGL